MMPWPDRRREWTDVRLDYYVSARNLIGSGFFHSAGILFAYAVETHLQAILYELFKGDQDREVKRDILKKHKITILYYHCKSLNLLPSVDVSDDFLQFIEDNFQRYPGQIIPIRNGRLNVNGVVHYGVSDIHYYDDLVIQLDKNILEYTKSLGSSIGVNALMRVDDICRIKFFQNNVHALSNIDYYLSKIESLDRNGYDRIVEHYAPTQLTEFKKKMTSGLPMNLMKIEDMISSTKAQDFEMAKSRSKAI